MICWLTVNRACNMRCDWCYAKSDSFSTVATMTLNVFKQILSVISLTSISRYILIGGEPTLHPKLPSMIKRLKPAKVVLVSNAVKLANKNYLQLLQDNGLDVVTVSLKGASEKQYKKNTGVACLHNVEQAIANLNELSIPYSISVTFSASIIDELPSIIKWMQSTNAKTMSINYCRPVIVGGKVSIDGVPHPRDMARKTIEAYTLIKKSGIKCAYNFMLPLCLLPADFIQELVAEDALTTVCQLQKGNGLIFMPDGKLVPCNHLFEYSLGKIGTDFVSVEEFEEHKKGGDFKSFYSKTRNFPDKRCQVCSLKLRCGGGCFIQYLHYKTTELVVQPFEGISL